MKPDEVNGEGGAFVVVYEHKTEQPIAMETTMGRMSYSEARELAIQRAGDPRIIRVCVARLSYEWGNEDLFARIEKGARA